VSVGRARRPEKEESEMRTTLTPNKLIGTLIVVVSLGALLVPNALARTIDGEPGTTQLGSPVYGPDAFERAVIANQAATLGDYRDAGHAVSSTSGAMVYPDAVERSQHLLQLDTRTGSPAPSDGDVDWGLIAMLASLGGFAVLGAAALVGVRQRTRMA